MEHKTIAAGIILIDKQTGDILLGKRSFQSNSPNVWAPFGGTFEESKDAGPQETAKREFKEETGGEGSYQISKTPFYVQTTPKLVFYTYLGVTNNKFPVAINKEHTNYGWFPLDSIPTDLHPGFKELISHKKSDLEKIIKKVTLNENIN